MLLLKDPNSPEQRRANDQVYLAVGGGYAGLPGLTAGDAAAPAGPLGGPAWGRFAAIGGYPPELMVKAPDLALLAVRAARRAAAADPDDANAYRQLAVAYLALRNDAGERAHSAGFAPLAMLRHVQAVTALRQTLLVNPDQEAAHDALANLFMQVKPVPFIDLAFEHRSAQLQLARRFGPRPRRGRGGVQGRSIGWRPRSRPLEKQVRDAQSVCAIRFTSIGDDPTTKANTALQLGLAGTALDDVLMKARVEVYGSAVAYRELELLVLTGRAREALDMLDDAEMRANKVKLLTYDVSFIGDSPVAYTFPTYEWLLACAASAAGDYGKADAALDLIGDFLTARQKAGPPSYAASVVADVGAPVGGVAGPSALGWLGHRMMHTRDLYLQADRNLRAERGDVLTLRGLLDLERGVPADAVKPLNEAAVLSRSVRADGGDAPGAALGGDVLEAAGRRPMKRTVGRPVPRRPPRCRSVRRAHEPSSGAPAEAGAPYRTPEGRIMSDAADRPTKAPGQPPSAGERPTTKRFRRRFVWAGVAAAILVAAAAAVGVVYYKYRSHNPPSAPPPAEGLQPDGQASDSLLFQDFGGTARQEAAERYYTAAGAGFAGLTGSSAPTGAAGGPLTDVAALGLRTAALAEILPDYGAEPPGPALQAVRDARHALAAGPPDADAWLRLAHAYLTLRLKTVERSRAPAFTALAVLRHVQVAAALRRALDLNPDLEAAHEILADLYLDARFYDAAYEQRHAQLLISRRVGRRPGEDADAAKRRLDALEAQDRELKKAVDHATDVCMIRSTGRPSPEWRCRTALSLGLPGWALDECLKAPADALGREGKVWEIELFLMTGRLAEVKTALDDRDARKNLDMPISVGLVSVGQESASAMWLPAYGWLRTCEAAAAGDYDAAGAALEEMGDQLEARQAPLRDEYAASVAADAAAQAGETGGPPALGWLAARMQLTRVLYEESDRDLRSRRADLLTLRGLLDLEREAPADAGKLLDEALALSRSVRADGGDSAGAALAEAYRKSLAIGR